MCNVCRFLNNLWRLNLRLRPVHRDRLNHVSRHGGEGRRQEGGRAGTNCDKLVEVEDSVKCKRGPLSPSLALVIGVGDKKKRVVTIIFCKYQTKHPPQTKKKNREEKIKNENILVRQGGNSHGYPNHHRGRR